MRRSRGHTLMEIVIYIIMVGLAATTIWALYDMARRTQATTYSSYLLNGQTEVTLGKLRRELQESALPAIVAYPNNAHKTEPPGVAFPSAYKDSMAVSAYGQPRWDHHVYYSLVPLAGQTTTGKLVRWEQDLAKPDFLPQLPLALPSAQTVKPSTALLNVVMPNQKVEGLRDQPAYQADQFGGFRVQFVRRAGGDAGAQSVSSENPSTFKDPSGNTKLLEVELKLLSRGALGKADFYTLRYMVHPKYPP